MTIVEHARVYATAAHAAVGQRRKYTFEPYIVHPTEVAAIVASVPHTDAMLAAAYLHDVVEDTAVTIGDIVYEFGSEVALLVSDLTDAARPEDGNRAERMAINRVYIANAPAESQTIKLADIISNCSSIVKYDPKFAVVYLDEKRQMLEVLTKGDPMLMARARSIVGA